MTMPQQPQVNVNISQPPLPQPTGWNILGSLIIVGPFIYTYKLLHAMNDLCADYNARG